jgi:excisionase family DNA binding protein
MRCMDMGNETKIRRTMGVDEVAKVLGIGRDLAYDACIRGEIPSFKIGKRILVPIAALERMLNVGGAAP